MRQWQPVANFMSLSSVEKPRSNLDARSDSHGRLYAKAITSDALRIARDAKHLVL